MAKVRRTEASFSFKKGLGFNSSGIHLSEQIDLEPGENAEEVRAKSLKRLKRQVMENIAQVQSEYEKANPIDKKGR